MTTALYSHPDCDAHVTPPGHPEQVARLEAVRAALDTPAFDALSRREAPMGTEAQVRLAHPLVHIDRIRAAEPTSGLAQIDADTSMAPGSFNAAMRAVGGVVGAVDAVMSGEIQNAFVACRPPGHHAEKVKPMGFCLFSNIAIAARHAMEEHGAGRVAILDFDVHHGNGTQDVLWNESRVRFVSSHEMPLYPGTGRKSETGAFDQIRNAPLAPGSDGALMREAWGELILPWIEEWEPELILVSAGFDAHAADPLASLNWTTEDFRWVTTKILDVADRVCDGRVVSTLEGGYDLNELGKSVAGHVETLMERGT